MKTILMMAVLMTAMSVQAETAAKAPAGKAPVLRKVQSVEIDADCRAKVEKLIRSTAKAMGLTAKFGLNLTTDAAAPDLNDQPLVNVNSGVFIVDDGYVSNSGATVLVRPTEKSCAILKLEISVAQ